MEHLRKKKRGPRAKEPQATIAHPRATRRGGPASIARAERSEATSGCSSPCELSPKATSSRHWASRRQGAPGQASIAHSGSKWNRSPKRPGARARELPATIPHRSREAASSRHRALRRHEASEPNVKRRGAQPGNHNAVKHGFYSTVYKASERRLLEQLPLTDLSAEIELIRVTNKRFLEALVASKGDLDFETQLTALRAVNLSAHSIATLLRAQSLTSVVDRDLAEAFAHLAQLNESPARDVPAAS